MSFVVIYRKSSTQLCQGSRNRRKYFRQKQSFPALKPIEVRSPHVKPVKLVKPSAYNFPYSSYICSIKLYTSPNRGKRASQRHLGLFLGSIGLCSSLGHRLGATSKVRTGSRKEKFQVACSHGNQSERHAQQRRQRVGRLALWLVDRLRQVGLDGQKKRRPR